MAVPGSYNLKWHAHNGHLNSSISMLYRSSAFTDVVLATSDGLYVSAHQFILSAYSKYFHNVIIVGGNSYNTNAKLVVVLPPQIGHSTLNTLLEYIYKGETVISEDQLPKIMKAAELLQIRGLYPSNFVQSSKSTNVLNTNVSSEVKSTSKIVKQYHKEMSSEARVRFNSDSIGMIATSPSSTSTSKRTKPNHTETTSEVRVRNSTDRAGMSSTSPSPNNMSIQTKPNHSEKSYEARVGYKSGSSTSNSPSSSSTTCRQISPVILSPVRKKHKGCAGESVLKVNQKKNDSAVGLIEEYMIEKMVVDKEVEVKEEPEFWDDPRVENNADIKEELKSEEEDVEVEVADENGYVPLTCDLCHKTFASPALWVRHIEVEHPSTALASGKRCEVDDDESKEFPPLECEHCQKVFSVPAEWVRHVKAHTEQQDTRKPTEETVEESPTTGNRIICTVCGKILNCSASMLIHLRTHTGERPFLCKLCGREFNVKSNYVRHMRTVHEHVDNSCYSAGTPRAQ